MSFSHLRGNSSPTLLGPIDRKTSPARAVGSRAPFHFRQEFAHLLISGTTRRLRSSVPSIVGGYSAEMGGR